MDPNLLDAIASGDAVPKQEGNDDSSLSPNPKGPGSASQLAALVPSPGTGIIDDPSQPHIERYGKVRVDRSGLMEANWSKDYKGKGKKGGGSGLGRGLGALGSNPIEGCEIISDPTNPDGSGAGGEEDGDGEDDACLTYSILGKDIELRPGMVELSLGTTWRVQKLVNLDMIGSSLKILKLVANAVEKIEGLETLVNLEHLELYQNRLKKIENLEPLVNLKHLDLSFNNIRRVDYLNGKLPFANKLEKLYLPNNKITEIPEDTISQFPKLQVLELGANRLREIPTCVRYLKDLRELWLGKNKIVNMSLEVDKNLEALFGTSANANVNDSPATTMTQDSTSVSPNGKLGNSLNNESSDGNAIMHPENVAQAVTNSDNTSTTVTNSMSNSNDESSDSIVTDPLLPNLKHCSIQANRLTQWDSSFFKNCPNLTHLYLSENQLSDFDFNTTFAHCKELRELDLSFNVITKIDKDFKLEHIHDLWINANKIDFDSPNDSSIAGLWNLKLKCLYMEHNPGYDSNYKDGGEKYKSILKKVCGMDLQQLDAIVFSIQQKIEEDKFGTVYSTRDNSVAGIRKIPRDIEGRDLIAS